MSETGWSAWIGERTGQETSAQRLHRQAWQAAERQEHAETIADAEQAAEAEDKRDQRLMRFHQAGITARTPGEVFDAGSRDLDEAAEYEDCAARMAVIDRRRARRAALAADQLAAMQRPDAPADPLEQASRRAHETFRAITRQQMAEAVTGAPRRQRRPFASRSRGAGQAVRSEHCYWCTVQGATDEEAFLIHNDPGHPLPVTTPEQAAQEGQTVQAERRQAGQPSWQAEHYGMAVR
jgi:hypothetical protein